MIKLIKSTFYREKATKKALTDFITNADMLSFNREGSKFEQAFSAYQGRAECIFVNSGSSANLALIQALLNLGYLKPGDHVGFSAVTWSTNVMPLIQLGLKPVPIDIELDTLNISARQIKKVIKTQPIKALFITHLLGLCDDLDTIVKVCKKNNIILIEDNCESLGSVYQGKKLGNFGLASTFSFYVGHHLSTIEGGMVTTDDLELARMLRLVRAHGWDRNLAEQDKKTLNQLFEINSEFYSRYTFFHLGYNFRPTEIAGFLGTYQLQFVDKIIKKRNENFLNLAPQLYSNPRYYPIRYDHMDFVSSFAFPLVCRRPQDRELIVKKVAATVEIRPIVGGNMTEQPFYKNNTKRSWQPPTPNAMLIHHQGFYFGNNPELTATELKILARVFGTV